MDETELATIFPVSSFATLIGNDEVTTTKTENTCDRIILHEGVEGGGEEFVAGSGSVFHFDDEFGLAGAAFVQSVSDHYPVFAEFEIDLLDDD